MEAAIGSPPNKQVGQARIHECKSAPACAACLLFGVTAGNPAGGSSRVSFVDAKLLEESAEELLAVDSDSIAGELKAEVAIDRVTSAANPRTIERVMAGAIFGLEVKYDLHGPEDRELLKLLLSAMHEIEDKGLGGHTSRGYGQVAITDVVIIHRPIAFYRGEAEEAVLVQAETIQQVVENYDQWIVGLNLLPVSGAEGGTQ
jgi:CRISPR-associated protein Csm3